MSKKTKKTKMAAVICVILFTVGAAYFSIVPMNPNLNLKNKNLLVYVYRGPMPIVQTFLPVNSDAQAAIDDVINKRYRVWYPNFIARCPHILITDGENVSVDISKEYIEITMERENPIVRNIDIYTHISPKEYETLRTSINKSLGFEAAPGEKGAREKRGSGAE